MSSRPNDKQPLAQLAVVLLSTLAAIVWSLLQVQVLYPFLREHFGPDVANLDGVIMLLPWACAFVFSPKLRRLFPIRLAWTWVSLLPMSAIFLNLVFLRNPDRVSLGFPMASLVLGGLATGFKEEFLFRGLAFLRTGNATPGTTVLLTALCFSLMHLLNFLGGWTGRQVEFTLLMTFAYGLSFGVMRIATGSIAWGVLIHGVLDATEPFVANSSRAYEISGALLMFTSVLVGIILWLRHPSMRTAGSTNSTSCWFNWTW